MALRLLNDKDFSQNTEEGKRWLSKAAKRGYQQAVLHLEYLKGNENNPE